MSDRLPDGRVRPPWLEPGEPERDVSMPSHLFAPGNKLSVGHGAPRLVKDGEELWSRFLEYVEWIETNPVCALRKVVSHNRIIEVEDEFLRPMTWQSFAAFLGVSTATLEYWRRDCEDLIETLHRIKDTMFANKFEGAAVGVFREAIISRELGLADHQALSVDLDQQAAFKPQFNILPAATVADLIHPDDPDPEGIERGYQILCTQAQLDAGMPFFDGRTIEHQAEDVTDG
ncbi:terminase small subunit [Rhodobacteraceae bacterium DSL-40]|uniref:terminase small subunit n=1 Tax=Amaricoccus sp. B4 TaxID=3368557 RepID=UPI000DAB7CF1